MVWFWYIWACRIMSHSSRLQVMAIINKMKIYLYYMNCNSIAWLLKLTLKTYIWIWSSNKNPICIIFSNLLTQFPLLSATRPKICAITWRYVYGFTLSIQYASLLFWIYEQIGMTISGCMWQWNISKFTGTTSIYRNRWVVS